jgi:hypothetical protein
LNPLLASYDSFKMIPEFLRYTTLEQQGVIVGEEGREFLMRVASEDPSADVRELATKLLQKSAENKFEETLDGGDGRFKTPEQLNGLYQLGQLYLVDDRNKAYLEGKNKPTFMRFSLIIPIIIGVTVVFTLGIVYGLSTGTVSGTGNPLVVVGFGGLVVGILMYIFISNYRKTKRYEAEGKLLTGQVIQSSVVIRKETVGSSGNRRTVRRRYLIINGIFNHPEHGKIQKTYEKRLNRSSMTFNGLEVMLNDDSKDVLPTGTAIAMMYVDDSLFAFI